MTIVAAGSIATFFEGVVAEAMTSQGLRVGDGVSSYVVGLLAEFAKPDARTDETFSRPLTFLLNEARNTPDRLERFDKLRVLGDGVLYSCGFFGEHFSAKGLDSSYLIGIGTSAYSEAGSILRGGTVRDDAAKDDIFRELASRFEALVRVLAYVSDSTVALSAARNHRSRRAISLVARTAERTRSETGTPRPSRAPRMLCRFIASWPLASPMVSPSTRPSARPSTRPSARSAARACTIGSGRFTRIAFATSLSA